MKGRKEGRKENGVIEKRGTKISLLHGTVRSVVLPPRVAVITMKPTQEREKKKLPIDCKFDTFTRIRPP